VGRDPEAEEGQAVYWLHSELRKKVGHLNIESGNDSRRAKAVKWICVLLSEEGARVHTPAVTARGGVGLDEGLPSLNLANLLYTENPYSYKKCQ
jgi:hypothetical protein